MEGLSVPSPNGINGQRHSAVIENKIIANTLVAYLVRAFYAIHRIRKPAKKRKKKTNNRPHLTQSDEIHSFTRGAQCFLMSVGGGNFQQKCIHFCSLPCGCDDHKWNYSPIRNNWMDGRTTLEKSIFDENGTEMHGMNVQWNCHASRLESKA